MAWIGTKASTLLLLLSVGVVGGGAYALLTNGTAAHPASAARTGTGTVLAAPPDRGGPPATPGPPTGTFAISGSVGGFAPGTATTLTLTVANPNPYPIRVLTLDTGVTAPAGCPASTLSVGRYDAKTGNPVSVAARGTARVGVPVRYADSATEDQSGCAGAAFSLAFTGTAVQGR